VFLYWSWSNKIVMKSHAITVVIEKTRNKTFSLVRPRPEAMDHRNDGRRSRRW
jgi:hypothetical protein